MPGGFFQGLKVFARVMSPFSYTSAQQTAENYAGCRAFVKEKKLEKLEKVEKVQAAKVQAAEKAAKVQAAEKTAKAQAAEKLRDAQEERFYQKLTYTLQDHGFSTRTQGQTYILTRPTDSTDSKDRSLFLSLQTLLKENSWVLGQE